MKFFFASLKSLKKGVRSGVESGSIVSGMDQWIRVCTKMSRIPNTDQINYQETENFIKGKIKMKNLNVTQRLYIRKVNKLSVRVVNFLLL